jgi:hypothetical protein
MIPARDIGREAAAGRLLTSASVADSYSAAVLRLGHLPSLRVLDQNESAGECIARVEGATLEGADPHLEPMLLPVTDRSEKPEVGGDAFLADRNKGLKYLEAGITSRLHVDNHGLSLIDQGRLPLSLTDTGLLAPCAGRTRAMAAIKLAAVSRIGLRIRPSSPSAVLHLIRQMGSKDVRNVLLLAAVWARITPPPRSRRISPGLSPPERTLLGPRWVEAARRRHFRATGLTHLLAVSGHAARRACWPRGRRKESPSCGLRGVRAADRTGAGRSIRGEGGHPTSS